MNFPETENELYNLLDAIDPEEYARTRNHLSGAVTRLSPYFTHGILQPRDVMDHLKRVHGVDACAKLLSEFGWREYYQRVWQAKGNEIWRDLKQDQEPVISKNLPLAVKEAHTGIAVIDDAVAELMDTGYMHNHARMWVASVVVNIAQTDWRNPAKWMFYHLLDGDLASNTLSWQWISGSFSHRKYIANQENLNRFSGSEQRGTYLDVSYEALAELEVPQVMDERAGIDFKNAYPESDDITLSDEHVLLYSIWNLDAQWMRELVSKTSLKRILLIEPSIYDEYPMSQKRWHFILHWARAVPDLEVFVGEMDKLFDEHFSGKISYREHPLSEHWHGEEISRKWMFPEVSGYYPSFSKFWKTAQRSLS